MVVAVVGGGNIGTLLAAEFAARGHEVRLLTSDPDIWHSELEVYDSADNLLMIGKVAQVTDDLQHAIAGAEIIWITYPAYLLEEFSEKLLPYITSGQTIGIVPGNNAEFFFREHVSAGAVLFGLDRVHSISRIRNRGRSVYMLGRKSQVRIASLPHSMLGDIPDKVGMLLSMPVKVLSHYLVETLTPSNPILHTTRIRRLFGDWYPGEYFDRNILFYEEWDCASSELLLACDDELQATCRILERKLGIDLCQVRSLREHYESRNAEEMTAKLSGISAFRGLGSPMKEVAPGRWEPDFEQRYFKADFAYGLKSICDIADVAGAETPNMHEVYDWYLKTAPKAPVFERVPDTIEALASVYC